MEQRVDLGPMDEHNLRLLQRVHPQERRNPAAKGRYNMVVIGAGSAGLVTAAGVAGLGGKVALIERNLLGGDCLNYGCVPSKTLIASARAAWQVRNAGKYGVTESKGDVDFAAVMRRLRRVRSEVSRHDAVERFSRMGVDVFFGDARFLGPATIEAAGERLGFARACIATGTRPRHPDIEGLAEAGFHTNETIFSLTELPPRLAVLGSGPIGCELGQAFARLGSEVTLIERGPELMAREDADAVAILRRALEDDGIHCILNANVRRVTADHEGRKLVVETPDGEQTVRADEILVGFGRVPNVEGLNLEAAGVEYDSRRGVRVNDYLRTTNRRIYAAGDVCLDRKFTHMADATARIVIRNALFWGRRKLSDLTVPWCTYTDPEIAHVGLYPHQAREKGLEVETLTETFRENDRAMTEGHREGFVRAHLKKGTDRILGATIVSARAGDMISEISLAMAGRIGLGDLADVIHPYPTRAEAIRSLADAWNRTRLTPRTSAWLKRILRWRR